MQAGSARFHHLCTFCCVQGHLRLVLLPIVYNAMAQKENLRALPLFAALQRAMRASSYECLLRHPPADAKPSGYARSMPLHSRIESPPALLVPVLALPHAPCLGVSGTACSQARTHPGMP